MSLCERCGGEFYARSTKGSQQAQPLQGQVHIAPTDYEMINNLVAGVQSGDSVALAALTIYPQSRASQSVATGRLARPNPTQRRRK